MTQIAQPQVHVSTLRSHRILVFATLGALVAAAAALTLVIAIGSGHNAISVPRAQSPAPVPGLDAGPAHETPSAVSQAFATRQLRGGFSMTTNVPALPRAEAGPTD